MQDKIKELLDKNYTKKEISKILDIGYSTVRKYSKDIKAKRLVKEHRCTYCNETDPSNFYGKMRSCCKDCHNQLGYTSQKEKIFDYAKSRGPVECSICGYDKLFAALEWHHRDPKEKDPSWNRGWNYARLKTELDKCDLVCANCHREIHYK